MCQVIASTAEAELGALFFTMQSICSLRQKQPTMPVQTDNNTARSGIINDMAGQIETIQGH